MPLVTYPGQVATVGFRAVPRFWDSLPGRACMHILPIGGRSFRTDSAFLDEGPAFRGDVPNLLRSSRSGPLGIVEFGMGAGGPSGM